MSGVVERECTVPLMRSLTTKGTITAAHLQGTFSPGGKDKCILGMGDLMEMAILSSSRLKIEEEGIVVLKREIRRIFQDCCNFARTNGTRCVIHGCLFRLQDLG